MKALVKSLLVTTLLSVSMISQARSAFYYISPSGTDSGNCPIGTPCATLNYAAGKMSAGDTLYLRGGTYSGSGQYLYNTIPSGSPDAETKVMAYPAETPTVASAGSGGTVVYLTSRNYIRIEGITFNGCTQSTDLMSIYTGCSHITVKNCIFKNQISTSPYLGIYQATYNTIDGCQFWDHGSATGEGTGDQLVLFAADHSTIQNCYFKNSGHYNILLRQGYPDTAQACHYNQILNNTLDDSAGGGGMDIVMNASYNLVDGNTFINIGGGISYTKTAVQFSGDNNSARRNVIYETSPNGGMAFQVASYYFEAAQLSRNNWIYNNTIYKAGEKGPIELLQNNNSCAGCTSSNHVFANNIMVWDTSGPNGGRNDYSGDGAYQYHYWELSFYNATTGSSGPTNGTRFYNNFLVHTVDGIHWITSSSPHASSRNCGAPRNAYCYAMISYASPGGSANWNYKLSQAQSAYPAYFYNNVESTLGPMFTNPANGDFTLQNASPCIDAGAVISDPNAATGGWSQLTYSGSAPDIGAYENTGRLGPVRNLRIESVN